MYGGFLDISAPCFLALWQEVTGKIIKLKRETHKAEDLTDLIILKLQLEDLSCFGEKIFLSTFDLQRLLKGTTSLALSCLVGVLPLSHILYRITLKSFKITCLSSGRFFFSCCHFHLRWRNVYLLFSTRIFPPCRNNHIISMTCAFKRII